MEGVLVRVLIRKMRGLGVACLFAAIPVWGLGAEQSELTLNFVNADIESVVKAVSQLTGRNFVIDPKVKGTVNIVSGKPVSRALAYQVLVSALRVQGFAVVEGAAVTKVLPEVEAKNHPSMLLGKNQVAGEQIATQVFHVRYESAAQLASALKPLLGPAQAITSHANGNALVVTDTADNLRRLEKILSAIDVPHGEDPHVVSLKYASALDVASTLNRLFAQNAQSFQQGQSPRILSVVAEPRSNRIVLRSDDPSLLLRARTLISELDQADSAGDIRVIPLRYAEAAKVAQTLRAILGVGTPAGTAGGAAPSTSPASTNPAGLNNAQGANSAIPSFQGNHGADQGALQSGSTIQADSATNSIIVIAPDSIYRNIRNVIEQLDRRRAQVYIEALVVELTAERAAEFGIQWQDLSGLGNSKTSLFGGVNLGGTGQNILSVSQSPASVGKGLNLGIVKGTVNIPGLGSVSNLGVLARFLESENKGNILSTPNILTLDNEEAKIVIGQNLPFVTGSYSNTGSSNGSVNPFQTYERKDVGLTLKVKPQITEGGVVRVQIYQEASSVQAATVSNASGPVTNKRSLETHVLVDDGSIIALGGLIEDSVGNAEDKVPFLGDAPLVGGLFRYETRNRKKTNLMVFIRPRIVRDALDSEEKSRAYYDRLRDAQQDFAAQIRPSWMGERDTPLLPSLKLSQPPKGDVAP